MLRHNLVLFVFPLTKLVLHMSTYRGYGVFRDEMYYVACAKHLAWGYVDHPPLSIFILWIATSLAGDSLFVLRLLPALAGAATVLVVGLITRSLGGGRVAQSLAMLAAITSPIYLALNHVFSMNSFDILLWALAALTLLRVLEQPRPLRWATLGLVLGLGLLNKISVLWLGFGLATGLLIAGHHRLLATRGPWIAAAVAGGLALPHLIWQMVMGWPTAEFIRNATQNKMVAVEPVDFLSNQMWMTNPALLPLWVGGLGWLVVARGGRFRVLAVIYVSVTLLLIVNGTSRAGYLAPAYTWLFAAGGVAAESLFRRWRPRGLVTVAAVVMIATGAALAPFALPVLPVDSYIAYAKAAGQAPSTEEQKELADLPQYYADMHGWESIVVTVASVFQTLSPAEQRVAVVFTYNYGDAGAVGYLGRKYGLPPAIGGHNNYWLWGPGEHTGEVILVVGSNLEDLSPRFQSVELGAMIDCGHCMPYENNRPVWIARGLRTPLPELWPRLKHYD